MTTNEGFHLENVTIDDRVCFIEMNNPDKLKCRGDIMCQFHILYKASSVIPGEGYERINGYRTRVYQGADHIEGINALLEKRSSTFKGKAKDLYTTSLLITNKTASL